VSYELIVSVSRSSDGMSGRNLPVYPSKLCRTRRYHLVALSALVLLALAASE
jgi:hypothetical protein